MWGVHTHQCVDRGTISGWKLLSARQRLSPHRRSSCDGSDDLHPAPPLAPLALFAPVAVHGDRRSVENTMQAGRRQFRLLQRSMTVRVYWEQERTEDGRRQKTHRRSDDAPVFHPIGSHHRASRNRQSRAIAHRDNPSRVQTKTSLFDGNNNEEDVYKRTRLAFADPSPERRGYTHCARVSWQTWQLRFASASFVSGLMDEEEEEGKEAAGWLAGWPAEPEFCVLKPIDFDACLGEPRTAAAASAGDYCQLDAGRDSQPQARSLQTIPPLC